MYFIVYDPQTGQVTSISQTVPASAENCLVSETALEGTASDYVVQDGVLYRKQAVEATDALNPEDETEDIPYTPYAYYICYNQDTGVVTSVTPYQNQATSPYIGTNTNPGDITGMKITDISSEVVDTVTWETTGLTPRTGEEGSGSTTVTHTHEITQNSYTLLISVPTRSVTASDLGDNPNPPDEAESDNPETETTPADTAIINATEVQSATDMIARITLASGNWAVRTGNTVIAPEDVGEVIIGDDEKTMVYVIASPYIRMNTTMQVLGINRGALRGDIRWVTENGFITFETDFGMEPYENVVIDCVFHATTDTWNAQGKIEAWPQGEWRKAQYVQSLQYPGWSLIIPAGESRLIETNLDFTLAKLLYLTAEWCGNTHAILTQYYINASTNKLFFRLTNVSASHIQLSEIILDVIYHGRLTNLATAVTELTAEDVTDTYITDADIDELT